METLRKRLARLCRPGQFHLLVELVRANFKITDQNTILGMTWSLIMPVFFTAVMFFLFRNRFSTGGPEYALFILIGVSTIGFFLNAVTGMMNIFQSSREMVLNTTVPRESLMVATMGNALIKYAIELLFAFCAAIALASPWWAGLPLLIPLIAALCALVMGIGMALAVTSGFTRDVQYLWVLVSRVLLFATPVFYQLNTVSPIAGKIVYYCNPISPFLVCLRRIIIGRTPEPFFQAYVHSLAAGFGLLLIVYLLFLRYEYTAVERS